MSETVSIVIPCYAQAHLIGEALRSSLTQDPSPGEIIVVDDGSPDDVEGAVATIGHEARVRVVRRVNGGLAAARNTGLLQACGSLVVFLDADDRLLPGALAAGLGCHAAHPRAAFVWGGFRNMDIDGRTYGRPSARCAGPDPYRDLLLGNIIGMHGTVMYRREALLAAGGFDEFLPSVEDWEIYLHLARHHQVACHRRIVAEYRRHRYGISANADRMITGGLIGLERHRPKVGEPREWAQAWHRGRARFIARYMRKAAIDGLAALPDGELRPLLAATRLALRRLPSLIGRSEPGLSDMALVRRGIDPSLAGAGG